jgi:hypothetical protein
MTVSGYDVEGNGVDVAGGTRGMWCTGPVETERTDNRQSVCTFGAKPCKLALEDTTDHAIPSDPISFQEENQEGLANA